LGKLLETEIMYLFFSLPTEIFPKGASSSPSSSVMGLGEGAEGVLLAEVGVGEGLGCGTELGSFCISIGSA
jgi:hypothetical protein